MNPQVDRSKPEAEQAMGEVALHKVGETVDGHRRARRPHARHARAVRGRAVGLPRLGHPPAGRQLRARVRHPDEHAGPQVHLPRLVLQAAQPLRLPALVALRRDGRRGDLRRRRDPPRARVPGRRPAGLQRGHHRHRLAQPHHAPGLHAGPREALVRVRPRPPAGGDHRRRPLRPHPGEARPDREHGRDDALGAGRRRGRGADWTSSASARPTSGPSWRCAARCPSGCRARSSTCS